VAHHSTTTGKALREFLWGLLTATLTTATRRAQAVGDRWRKPELLRPDGLVNDLETVLQQKLTDVTMERRRRRTASNTSEAGHCRWFKGELVRALKRHPQDRQGKVSWPRVVRRLLPDTVVTNNAGRPCGDSSGRLCPVVTLRMTEFWQNAVLDQQRGGHRDTRPNECHSGIVGTREQDAAVVEGMGVLADRGREHLGTSDIPIIAMRRRLLGEAKALRDH